MAGQAVLALKSCAYVGETDLVRARVAFDTSDTICDSMWLAGGAAVAATLFIVIDFVL